MMPQRGIMTLDDKTGEKPHLSDDRGTPPGEHPAYEAPVLIPLGNVHALLAGSGHSVSTDGTPKTHRLP